MIIVYILISLCLFNGYCLYLILKQDEKLNIIKTQYNSLIQVLMNEGIIVKQGKSIIDEIKERIDM